MKEVVKKEMIKWLDACIIYPISYNSPVMLGIDPQASKSSSKGTFSKPYPSAQHIPNIGVVAAQYATPIELVTAGYVHYDLGRG